MIFFLCFFGKERERFKWSSCALKKWAHTVPGTLLSIDYLSFRNLSTNSLSEFSYDFIDILE